MATSTRGHSEITLSRTMGLLDITMIGVGAMIGAAYTTLLQSLDNDVIFAKKGYSKLRFIFFVRPMNMAHKTKNQRGF